MTVFQTKEYYENGFFFCFDLKTLNLAWAREGRSGRGINSENFFQSLKKIFTDRSRHLLFFKTSFQYYTAAP